ncbi:hypothetical protein TNCV_1000391 [Trichonephila clavipes]|nr:hypothetical protein TNCV_1000391 [Trichonephila clavipes]
MCTNCSSEQATPAHILECPGLTKQDLADVPLLVLDYLKVYDVMDLPRIIDLRVSLVNNGLVGPYSATVLVTLPSVLDHRPPRLESARSILPPSLTLGGCLDSALY